jgi:hypothetical protein
MSFANCILGNPALRPAQAQKLIAEYDELFERYQATMGDDMAAAAAAKKYIDIQEKIIAKKNENIVRDVLAWENLNPKIDRAAASYQKNKDASGMITKKLYGKSNVAAATRSLLESVYTRQQSLERRATLAIGEAIEKYRSKTAGLKQDSEGFKDVVRGIFDGKTNNDGKAIREVFDYLHRMYEQSGGVIGKLDNYFPQSHNAQLVGRTDKESWKNFIRPLLDADKMIDPDTGMPFSSKRLDQALNETYEGIRTNGLDEIARRAEEGKQTFGKGGGVSQRRSSSRFLHFKDADSFFKYNDTFGYGNEGLFDAMMGHISTMTRDIAIMQELGPKPESQMSRLKLKATADKAGPQAINTINGMYDVLAGRTSYNGELPGWYVTMGNIQNLLRSSLLGGAPVSAMSDSFYGAFTSKMNGVPAVKFMAQYAKILNPADARDRQMARRLGFVASAASGNSIKNARFMDDANGRGMFGWLAGFTNRASGLAVMTDATRQATVLGTQGFMAEAKAMKVKWDELDPAMREAFQRWDMTEQDYKNIISAKSYIDPDTEADFIRSEDVAMVDVETATKYDMWLTDMAQQASNEPRLLTRAIATGAILGDAKEGTVLRSTASSLMMFKSFGITVLLNHMLPALRHMGTARGADRLSHIVPILFFTTVLGAVSIQTRDVLYGKTPREMNEKFWGAAMMQGGGFGIFGDFLFSDQSRFGADIFKTLAGPMVGFGTDVYKVFKGNFDKALDDGQESKFMADLFQFSKRYIPAVKLWYTRLLLERLMLDQAERAIDPNFDNRMRRLEGKNREERGQKSWWASGDTLPQ